MTRITLLFLLFISSHLCFSQDRVTTAITDFATIDFPNTVEYNELAGMPFFSAIDAHGRYIVTVSKFTDMPNGNLEEEERAQLYDGTVDGYLKRLDGELIISKDIKISSVTTREIEYEKTAPDTGVPHRCFKRIIFINKHLIQIDFWLSAEKNASLTYKNDFFNSLSITSRDSYENASKNESAAYKIGKAMGSLIAFFALIFVFLIFVVILVFSIRYFVRKKSKTQPKKVQARKANPQQVISRAKKISCKQCESENAHNAKYCSRCGYAL